MIRPIPPWLPYVAPMALFLILTSIEGQVVERMTGVGPPAYPAVYTIKILVVGIAAWLCRSAWADYRPAPTLKQAIVAVIAGLAVTAVWVGSDGWYPSLPFMGSRSAYDPTVLPGWAFFGFVFVRSLGLVVLVPVVEEVFWRSFLNRWIIDQDFTKVPVGKVTSVSAAVVSGLFALAHPEWLPALLTGLAWAGLLAWSGRLSTCLLSHVTANAALGLYVVVSGDWKYW